METEPLDGLIDGGRFLRQPEANEIDRVIRAAQQSNGAIRYAGEDSGVLKRFRRAGLEELCDAPALRDWREGPAARAFGWGIARIPASWLRAFGKVVAGRIQAR